MTLGGWITFLASVCGFFAFFAWCLYKVATAGKQGGAGNAFDIYEIEGGAKQRRIRRRSGSSK